MYWKKEYVDTLTVSLQNLRDMQKAQYAMWNEGFKEQNFSNLTASLGAVSTILSFAFGAPTVVAVVSAISGLISELGSGLQTTEDIVKEGHWKLQDLVNWMESHPQYDLIKVKMSFLEFYGDYNIRFVEYTSSDYITAVHTSNGWILSP